MTRDLTHADAWAELRRHTPARIALGRAGGSLPTREVLAFGAAHAQARDAVHLPLDVAALRAELPGAPAIDVASRAPDRASYLRRPDWGRQLHDDSAQRLREAASPGGCDVAVVAGDGLSALAAQRQLPPLLAALMPLLDGLSVAPLVIATQARVALGDEVGELLGARLVLMLIGERPGLSSPDSLGAYLTYAPRPGRLDAERNCVSNIRPEGLAPALAAARVNWLLRESLRRRLSGIALKDGSDTPRIA
jgi:ethanolamine ammonia-lyase small subunit